MEDDELLRYSRQIMLPDMDIAGQEALQAAKVLIIGVGGLGSPAALYLAAAGVGHLVLSDHDTVDLSNLQRQIAHDTASLGQAKVSSAAERLARLNPHTKVTEIPNKLSQDELVTELSQADLVLDCSDNFATRFVVNAAAWAAKTPLVSGAGIGWEGQVAVFDPNRSESPCYQCLHPEGDDAALNCAENGVVAPLVGVIGTLQALEAIKVITGVGETLVGKVAHFDGKYMEWRSLSLRPRTDCPVCSG